VLVVNRAQVVREKDLFGIAAKQAPHADAALSVRVHISDFYGSTTKVVIGAGEHQNEGGGGKLPLALQFHTNPLRGHIDTHSARAMIPVGRAIEQNRHGDQCLRLYLLPWLGSPLARKLRSFIARIIMPDFVNRVGTQIMNRVAAPLANRSAIIRGGLSLASTSSS
jgi:hypothetical protein